MDYARFDLDLNVENNVKLIRLPTQNKARERRLKHDEIRLLLGSANPFMRDVITVLVQTGLRRGELCKLFWHDVDFERRLINIRDSKNGDGRLIPMSTICINAFTRLKTTCEASDSVINISPDTLTHNFQSLCQRAGIDDYRIHDLRHEATSRLFEIGLNTAEVSTITGHKSLSMLKRYTHISPEHLLSKMA